MLRSTCNSAYPNKLFNSFFSVAVRWFDILKIYIKFTAQHLRIVIHVTSHLNIKISKYFPTKTHYRLVVCNYKICMCSGWF